MTDRYVLLLAVGGTRRRGVVEAASQVVAAGGRARVVIGDPDAWSAETFDPRVDVVALGPAERRRIPVRVEQALLYTGPVSVLRAVGGERVARTYRSRVADRVHRRALPLIRTLFGDRRHRQLGPGPAVDALVVADSPSMPLATRLLRDGLDPALVTFDVTDAQPGGGSSRS